MRRREKSYVSKFSLVGAAMLSVGILFSPAAFVHASERPQLRNPIIHENQVNEWDCVYFGSYPQHSDGEGGYLVEPIKWRVIKVEGDHAYLMSDQLIDCMRFNEEGEQLNTSCLYEVSTVRSWLNGYDASQNKMKIDYTDFNFIDRAFTQEEQAAIEVTHVDNQDEIEYPHSYDDTHRKDTDDKIFLPSITETTTPEYGFTLEDDPTFTRVAYNTGYAAAGGSSGSVHMRGEGEKNSWILRSPGEYSMYCAFFCEDGRYDDVEVDGNMVESPNHGIRPCLYLDLTKTDVYEYAGVVQAKKEQVITTTAAFSKRYGDSDFTLPVRSNGDGAIHFESDHPEIVSVDDQGRVHICGIGEAAITIIAEETDEYLQGLKTAKITVKKGYGVIEAEDCSLSVLDGSYQLPVKSTGSVTYSCDQPEVCTIDDEGRITIHGLGTAVITILSDENDLYLAASKTIVVMVEKAKQTITAAKVSKVYGDKAFALGAKAKTGLTYTSSDSAVCTVNAKGKVTIKGAGIATITIKAKEDSCYKAASKKISVTVTPSQVKIDTLTSSSAKSIKVSWKKCKEVTGYEISHAYNKKFTNSQTVTVKKMATISTTIKKLTYGKTCYVRIRGYKKSGSKKLYGAWSAVKKVKVK